MKKGTLIFLILWTLGMKAQDSLEVSITNWKNDLKAAIVFSFDDWSPGHGEIVIPMFIKHKVPATFFVTTKNKDLGGSWAMMKKAFDHGCEIGNHTETHPDLAGLDSMALYREVVETQNTLREKVNPRCGNTIAFPFGTFNGDVLDLVKKDHIGARLAGLRYGRSWPYSLTYGKTDYFQLQTFMVRDIYTPKTNARIAKQAVDQGGMVTYMYHSIFNDSVNDHWFGALPENLLEANLKEVKKVEGVWITTFEKAIMYHKEKANSKFNVKKMDNGLEITLECVLDSSKYFEELTFKLSHINCAVVETIQSDLTGEGEVTFSCAEDSKSILFNVPPITKKIQVKFRP